MPLDQIIGAGCHGFLVTGHDPVEGGIFVDCKDVDRDCSTVRCDRTETRGQVMCQEGLEDRFEIGPGLDR